MSAYPHGFDIAAIRRELIRQLEIEPTDTIYHIIASELATAYDEEAKQLKQRTR